MKIVGKFFQFLATFSAMSLEICIYIDDTAIELNTYYVGSQIDCFLWHLIVKSNVCTLYCHCSY